MSRKNDPTQLDQNSDERLNLDDPHQVKSAMEIALEKAAGQENELFEVETEQGTVSLTFEDLKNKALQADELVTQLQYKQAEFENFRKRTQREREELLKETVRVPDLLDLLDHLDRAMGSEGDVESIREGVGLIRGQLWTLLERKGIERITVGGETFDPNFHEAVAHQPHDELPQGAIAEEYQPGYRLGEKVIRPSKVVVSAGAA